MVGYGVTCTDVACTVVDGGGLVDTEVGWLLGGVGTLVAVDACVVLVRVVRGLPVGVVVSPGFGGADVVVLVARVCSAGEVTVVVGAVVFDEAWVRLDGMWPSPVTWRTENYDRKIIKWKEFHCRRGVGRVEMLRHHPFSGSVSRGGASTSLSFDTCGFHSPMVEGVPRRVRPSVSEPAGILSPMPATVA